MGCGIMWSGRAAEHRHRQNLPIVESASRHLRLFLPIGPCFGQLLSATVSIPATGSRPLAGGAR